MKNDQREKFHDLLKDFETAVLITHGQETHFHARPMVIARLDDNCDLWFITGADSMKAREIDQDGRAHVVCQKGWTSCLSIAGRATLVQDRSKIRELWKPSYKVWFPQGAEDPNLALIHFSGENGEYWDNTGANRLRYVYEALKAVAQHKTPEVHEGEQHGHVELMGRK